MMAEFYFIINPTAGAGASLKKFEKVTRVLKERGISYETVYTERARHATTLAADAATKNHTCIVAVGGDGTALEVAAGLSGTEVAMGILPSGTGNDLCRALKIPMDMDGALDILLNGQEIAIDGALANDSLFFNASTFGFDVDVVRNTQRYKKYVRGMLAYLLGLLRALFTLRLVKATVTSKELTVERDVLLIAVANGTHYGGGMNVAPLSHVADGYLDVCIVHDVNRLTVLKVLSKFIKGKHLSTKYVTYFKTKALTITTDPITDMQRDGEIVGKTPIKYSILPGMRKVRCGIKIT